MVDATLRSMYKPDLPYSEGDPTPKCIKAEKRGTA